MTRRLFPLLLIFLAACTGAGNSASADAFLHAFFDAYKTRDSAALKRLFITDAERQRLFPRDSTSALARYPGDDTTSAAYTQAVVWMAGLPYFPRTAYDSARWDGATHTTFRDARTPLPLLRGTFYFRVRAARQQLEVQAAQIDGHWKALSTGVIGFGPDGDSRADSAER